MKPPTIRALRPALGGIALTATLALATGADTSLTQAIATLATAIAAAALLSHNATTGPDPAGNQPNPLTL